MSTLSANAQAVLNAITATAGVSCYMACGDPQPFPKEQSQSLQMTNAVNAGDKIYTSGFMAPAESQNADYKFNTTVSTTGALPTQSGITITLPNTNGYTWVIPNGNTLGSGDTYTQPWIGDPIGPNSGGIYPNPFIPYNPPFVPQPTEWPPIKIKPDLEQLEEGTHDIPGGKIIIKKIKVSEEQLEEAIKEALGPDVTPEEKTKIKEELENIQASEEREI